MSLGYARSAQLRGTASISSGKTLTATGRDTPFTSNKPELVLPIDTSGGNPRVRQPVVRDVVEHVVSCKALDVSVEDTCDQLVADHVVVDHPLSQADG